MRTLLQSPASKQRTGQVRALLHTYQLHPWHLYAARIRTQHQPYHNYQHCYQVALDAVEGSTAEGLSQERAKVAFIAALYHDHNHTGNHKLADQVNIRRALKGARFWLWLLRKNLTRVERERATWLIAMTENSHSTKSNMAEMDVIRDADLLTTTGVDSHAWQQALSQEQHFNVDDANTLQFLQAHPLTTKWGQQRVSQFAARVTKNVVG